MGHRKGAVRAGTTGMHAPFRNHFTVEMGQLLLKPDVLHKHGAARTGGQGMIIIGHGAPALVVSESLFFILSAMMLFSLVYPKGSGEKKRLRTCLYCVGKSMARLTIFVNSNYYYF